MFQRMSRPKVVIKEAKEAWQCLQGLFCVYKPPHMSMKGVKRAITTNITKDLNNLRYTRPKFRVEIQGN